MELPEPSKYNKKQQKVGEEAAKRRPTSAVVRSQNLGLVDILNPLPRKIVARKPRPETAPAKRTSPAMGGSTSSTAVKRIRPQTATARVTRQTPNYATTPAAAAKKMERPKTAGGNV